MPEGFGVFMAAAQPYFTAGGFLIQAAGALSQGRNAQAMADYNAQVAENEAIAARQHAAFEEDKHRRNLSTLLSAQKAASAKSGVTPEGSSILVQAETAAEGELDALTIRYSGTVAAARAASAAAQSRLEGRFRRTAGYYSAGGSLLTGASKIKISSSSAGGGIATAEAIGSGRD